jgi:quinol monooxygenase YgiN
MIKHVIARYKFTSPCAFDRLGMELTNMYGTIARFRLKPGMEVQAQEQFREFETAHVKGFTTTYCYRMDANANEYYLAVIFDSKESYWANAQSPEQDARYRRLLSLMEGEPEWHDGEIIAVARGT